MTRKAKTTEMRNVCVCVSVRVHHAAKIRLKMLCRKWQTSVPRSRFRSHLCLRKMKMYERAEKAITFNYIFGKESVGPSSSSSTASSSLSASTCGCDGEGDDDEDVVEARLH